MEGLEQNNNQPKYTKIFGITLFGCMLFMVTLLWIFVSAKAALISMGVFSFCMLLNITMAAIANTYSGMGANINDTFWRILFTFTTAICLGIGLAL